MTAEPLDYGAIGELNWPVSRRPPNGVEADFGWHRVVRYPTSQRLHSRRGLQSANGAAVPSTEPPRWRHGLGRYRMGGGLATENAIVAHRTTADRASEGARWDRRWSVDGRVKNRCDARASARESFIQAFGQPALLSSRLIAVDDTFAGGDVQRADGFSETLDRRLI